MIKSQYLFGVLDLTFAKLNIKLNPQSENAKDLGEKSKTVTLGTQHRADVTVSFETQEKKLTQILAMPVN